MKHFFSSLLISFALLLLIPTVSAIEPPAIGFTFVDGLGDPITSPIRIRVSLWSVPDITTTDFQGSGALETASSAYADYQTTLVVNPVSTGYFRLDLSTLAGFPALTDSNKYLQVEWKSPPTGTSDGYAVYDFSRDVSTARDRIPLILENGVAYEDFLLSTEDYDFDIFQETADTFTITFGSVLGETLTFDVQNDAFEMSNDLSLLGNELQQVRFENLAAAPSCDFSSRGRVYYNTTSDLLEVCDGTLFQGLGGGNLDAMTLNGVSDDQFLRSDTSDVFSNGQLIFLEGSSLINHGTFLGTGAVDLSFASQFVMRQGPVNPPLCDPGEEFFNTVLSEKVLCLALNTWSVIRTDFFGTQYAYAEDETVSTSSSRFFQEKLRLTTPALPAGVYRIGWSYQWNHDSSANDFEARVQLDDSQNLEEHVEEPQDSGGGFGSTGSNQQFTNSGFQHVSLSTGVHTVDIDYRTSDSGGDESSIWNARLEIWRVQ